MNPVRKRRLIVALVIVAAVGIATAISVFALQQNVTYLYSPSEVDAGKAPADGVFRLGGIVAEGSVHKVAGTLQTDFVLTDRFENIPVKFTGILPDLFRVGQSTITTGRMEHGTFVATKVLAKHDATYMPPQVAQAIAKAKEEHRIPAEQLPPPPAGEGRGGGGALDSPHPPSGHLPPQAGEGNTTHPGAVQP